MAFALVKTGIKITVLTIDTAISTKFFLREATINYFVPNL